MGAVYFYHLTRSAPEAALAALAERSLGAGWRVAVRLRDRERAAWLDSDDQVIAEADLYDAVSETVSQQIGVREFSDTGDVAAEGTPREIGGDIGRPDDREHE